MIKDSSKILIVDAVTTMWDHPTRQKSEILAIGWCWLNFDKNIEPYPEFKIIKPQKSCVSHYCTEITKITSKEASRGVIYQDACKYFINRMGFKKYMWASFGSEVKTTIESQCKEMNAPFFLSESHIDISDLASIRLQMQPRSSMQSYLEKTDAEYIKEPQDMLDLIFNTATLLREILNQK